MMLRVLVNMMDLQTVVFVVEIDELVKVGAEEEGVADISL